MKKFLAILIPFLLLLGGIAIVASSLTGGVFYLTIEEVLASQSNFTGRELKVVGRVVPGTVLRRQEASGVVFAVSDANGRSLGCLYKGVLPDAFGENREVILQGVLRHGPMLEAKKIIVKCPAKYREKGLSEEDEPEYYQNKYRSGHSGQLQEPLR